ncbi:hypothetical protein [Cognatishimia sp. F0-27]|uniref:hypothetical protein n=1 Tax=Cognatishimia sp. F0-27 TaxID=2816855 RepID=UPI001D0C151F|nr:hypothetical protein [Cognatishimia sp. F0-27]MCC1492593.1 hypothetical protein [Cognatishimia sp. F0-27]
MTERRSLPAAPALMPIAAPGPVQAAPGLTGAAALPSGLSALAATPLRSLRHD